MVWGRLIDSISRGMAFYPPSPPTYTLDSHGDGAGELYIKPVQPGLKKVVRAEVLQLPVGQGRGQSTIVAAFVPAPHGRDAVRCTILHSHGNAADLGQMMPLYEHLARQLQVNVMGYDYSGYGQSSGQPGASTTLENIQAVYQCLLERFGRRPEDIVLYGQSVGSGPTSWLAARRHGVAGVVLHSPFLSGIRVLRGASLTRWPAALDIFPNVKHVPKIACPVLIVHGTNDGVIDVTHGKKLHALCKRPSEPLWAEGLGHNDVEGHREYIPTLRRFLMECWGDGYATRAKRESLAESL